jgi:hypothetical protein
MHFPGPAHRNLAGMATSRAVIAGSADHLNPAAARPLPPMPFWRTTGSPAAQANADYMSLRVPGASLRKEPGWRTCQGRVEGKTTFIAHAIDGGRSVVCVRAANRGTRRAPGARKANLRRRGTGSDERSAGPRSDTNERRAGERAKQARAGLTREPRLNYLLPGSCFVAESRLAKGSLRTRR